jgi:hypothetical protein
MLHCCEINNISYCRSDGCEKLITDISVVGSVFGWKLWKILVPVDRDQAGDARSLIPCQNNEFICSLIRVCHDKRCLNMIQELFRIDGRLKSRSRGYHPECT